MTDDQPMGEEFHLCECGYEECRPTKPYEFITIDYWVIHYCIDGEGYFQVKDHQTHIHAGDIFMIPPYTRNKYYPKAENPWTYQWIGMKGTLARQFLEECGLTPESHVLHHKIDLKLQTMFEQVFDNFHEKHRLKAFGITFQLLDYIKNNVYNSTSDSLTSGELYYHAALNYISKNYTNNITISDIATAANIDRTYLFKLFQKFTGKSPSQYLQNFRLDNASVLLRKSSLSVTDIAYMVGFQQSSYFSKMFTQYKGVTPSEYRKEFIRMQIEEE